MLNRIAIMGRLTREPELKTTQSGVNVCTITLACERDYAAPGEQREADFFDVVCWRGTAEFAARYFRKGQLVACEGRLQTRKWRDKHDQNRVTTEILADHLYFAERTEKQEANPAAGYDAAMNAAKAAGVPAAPRGWNPAAANIQTGGWPEYNEPGDLPHSDYYGMEDDDDVPF